MPSIVVSTCGTSLLTNKVAQGLNDLLRKTANAKANDLSKEEKNAIDAHMKEREETLLALKSFGGVRDASAELNGLLGLYEEQPSKGKNDLHYLLHTDTYQGKIVAEALKCWCEQNKLNAQTYRIESLNTRDLEDFRIGIGNLMKWCQDTLSQYTQSGYRVIFNLVGGFKSLQGYMQTLGMLFADESIYIFEGQRALLRIPRLPLDLDTSSQKTMRENIAVFRKLARKSLPYSECAALPETFLYRMGHECTLSDWGKLLWERFKKSLYSERLLEPPSARIRYSAKLKNTIATLDAQFVLRINEKMDDLAGFFEQEKALKSLSFKKLTGTPVPQCTHEFYLWSDKDAARGFGYFDGSVFIFEDMREHL